MADYTVLSPHTCTISPRAKIGKGAVIWPNNVLLGDCDVGENAVLYPGNIIEDSSVGAGARVTASVLRGAWVGENAQVGPFAHLRPGAQIGEECRIGSFVEIKNARLCRGVRAGHLAYIGDADVGANTNIGCGVVFCNYDGARKYRSSVGENCFLGSNVNVVAPASLGAGCYIAAGTTLSGEVPPGSFAVGRAKATVRPDTVGRYAPAREAKKSAPSACGAPLPEKDTPAPDCAESGPCPCKSGAVGAEGGPCHRAGGPRREGAACEEHSACRCEGGPCKGSAACGAKGDRTSGAADEGRNACRRAGGTGAGPCRFCAGEGEQDG